MRRLIAPLYESKSIDCSSASKEAPKRVKSTGFFSNRETFGPLFLMSITPPLSIIVAHVNKHSGGSFKMFWGSFFSGDRSFISALCEIWPNPFDPVAWKYILCFMLFQLTLMRLVPGKTFYGPITPAGNQPIYKVFYVFIWCYKSVATVVA